MADAALSYWTSHLRDGCDLPILELPVDHPRPPLWNSTYNSVPFLLSPEVLSQLDTLPGSVSLEIASLGVLVAVWATLLCQHSNQEEIVVGVKYSDHVLPLLINVAHGMTRSVQESAVKNTVACALENAFTPFAAIVAALTPQLPHDNSRAAIFQTTVDWESRTSQEASFSHSDVDLRVDNAADSIEGNIIYAADLFEAITAERLAQRFEVLCAAWAQASPNTEARSLNFLSDDEREMILFSFNDTSRPLSPENSMAHIHDLVAKQTWRFGMVRAIERTTPQTAEKTAQTVSLTYAQLEVCADALAWSLATSGIECDSAVALQLPKSIEMAVAILGVLRSGACYLPLDMAWPLDRRVFIVDDTSAKRLVVSLRHPAFDLEIDRFPGSIDVFRLDASRQRPLNVSTCEANFTLAFRQDILMPANLAYIIYTSGSTGRPKGVLIEHGGVVNLLVRSVPLYAETRVNKMRVPRCCISMNYVFDAFQQFFFTPLCIHGGTCVMLDSGLALLTLDKEMNFDVLADVPSVMALARVPKATKLVHIMGEALSRGVIQAVQSHDIPRLLWNWYGPTEVTINVTRRNVPISDIVKRRLASIGGPLDNVKCYIIEPKTFKLRPIGVFGELLLGGPQVARGYLNQSGKTEAAFLKNIWSDNMHKVMYRTGDLCRWFADGEVEFSGRIDFQVKLRGYRIELGEVEHALTSQPGVIEAVALLRESHGNEPKLIGYIHPPINTKILLKGLAKTLPSYMIPQEIISIENWPRTSSAKIDRSRLPKLTTLPSDCDSFRDRNLNFPTTVKLRIKKLVSSVGINLKSDDENFFDIGTSSLVLMQLVLKIRCQFNAVFTLRDLRACSSINALAHEFARDKDIDAMQSSTKIPDQLRYNFKEVAKISQTGMWRVTLPERAFCFLVRVCKKLSFYFKKRRMIQPKIQLVQRFYPLSAPSLIMCTSPNQLPTIIVPSSMPLSSLTASISCVARIMPCITGILTLEQDCIFLLCYAYGIPFKVHRAFNMKPSDLIRLPEATFNPSYLVWLAQAGFSRLIGAYFIWLVSRSESMLVLNLRPAESTWGIELVMNHAMFYGPVQHQFLKIWRRCLSTKVCILNEFDETVFGALHSHLVDWLRSSKFLKSESRLRNEIENKGWPRGLVYLSCCMYVRPSLVLDRKQVMVLQALEWFSNGIPPHYIQMHVFMMPPMQLHRKFGHDPDLSTMMWWTTPPFVMLLQGVKTNAEAIVLCLWKETEKALDTIVDESCEQSIKSTWLKKMSLLHSHEIPRYALCTNYHPDSVRFKLAVLSTQYKIARSGALFVLSVNLNVENNEKVVPFMPYITNRPCDNAEVPVCHSKSCMSMISGAVYASLEIRFLHKKQYSLTSFFTLLPG